MTQERMTSERVALSRLKRIGQRSQRRRGRAKPLPLLWIPMLRRQMGMGKQPTRPKQKITKRKTANPPRRQNRLKTSRWPRRAPVTQRQSTRPQTRLDPPRSRVTATSKCPARKHRWQAQHHRRRPRSHRHVNPLPHQQSRRHRSGQRLNPSNVSDTRYVTRHHCSA